MAARPSIDVSGWLEEQLAHASPDLLRSMVQTFAEARMLARVDAIDADIKALDAKIEELIAPFAAAVDRLDEVDGIGRIAAACVIAEIGVDMTRFPTAGHLDSWAKYAPGTRESAGKKTGKNTTGHGKPVPGPGPRRSRHRRRQDQQFPR